MKAEDLGNYYRVPADTRDLNYAKFFVDGDESLSQDEDYTSENTERLDVEGMIEMLMKLDFIKNALKSD